MPAVNEQMMGLGNVRSAIRDLFEYGLKRKAEIGAENVFDYSLGNPSVPAPRELDEKIAELALGGNSVALHGYTSAAGAQDVREAVAEDINRRFGAGVKASDIYMTCGAAASLTISLRAITCPGDEIIGVAPFFPEYRVFAETQGAVFRTVPADEKEFQIDFDALEAILNPHTKGIIINSPNNPSGAVLSRANVDRLTGLLRKKEQEYGTQIFLICDEPYRELVYDDIEVPYMINEYDDTLVCYSFSKSLSLPGERIGYIVVSNRMKNAGDVFAAVAGAGRGLGYVCAPSMMQRVVKSMLGKTSDIGVYRLNRDLLYDALTEYGYECVHPDGAFYLFVKTPGGDAKAFCEKAKDYELLLVPSDSFGVGGYARLSYCVSTDMVKRSLPAFRRLIEDWKKEHGN